MALVDSVPLRPLLVAARQQRRHGVKMIDKHPGTVHNYEYIVVLFGIILGHKNTLNPVFFWV